MREKVAKMRFVIAAILFLRTEPNTMSPLSLVAILLFAFGALSHGALAVSFLQARSELTSFLLTCYAAIWFVVNLILVFNSPSDPTVFEGLPALVFLVMTLLWPPIMMHAFYAGCVAKLRSKQPWRIILILTYGIAAAVATWAIGNVRGAADAGLPWPSAAFVGLFATAGVYSALLLYVTPRLEDRRGTQDPIKWRKYKNAAWLLSALLILVMVLVLLPSLHPSILEKCLNLVSRSFPLIFLVVNTYYLERFTFFDVFVKRGTFSLAVLGLLTIYFYIATRAVDVSSLEGVTPWLLALTLLPIALSLPWLYRRLETWLDRVWLGRKFDPESAVRYFLSAMQSATTEGELVQHAESRLTDMFRARAEIALGNDTSARASFESVVEIPIRMNGDGAGVIFMGERPGSTPYFSRDVDLLTSLADVFSNMLENVRFQRKKQNQEKRQRELEIHASRSELKALRAQVNPHFLFNALNAIAGLIHKNPRRAEETVEQLSEVFRYTLTSSEKEWARLEDEIEFVRSYLDIEKARFGTRLQTSIDVEDSVRGTLIPAMIVQTIVENAIKHGVARIRGTGYVSVRARLHRAHLLIEVEDNGPGFTDNLSKIYAGRQSTGHGLRSIRERLHGYFGDEALLKVARDNSKGLTTITIRLPIRAAKAKKEG